MLKVCEGEMFMEFLLYMYMYNGSASQVEAQETKLRTNYGLNIEKEE